MTPVTPVELPGQPTSSSVTALDAPAFTRAPPPHVNAGQDRPGLWLHAAAGGLCVLSGAAATVSFTAQYRLVYAARRLAGVAGLEAAIPDVAALVFASLGVALAMEGRRA